MDQVFNFLENNLFPIILVVGIIACALLLWNIFLQWQLTRTKKKIKMFFKGRRARDLEEVIAEHLKKTKEMDKDIKELFSKCDNLDARLLRSIRKVGVVRFNPFKDTGGDQSFAIALLDEDNNGLVISSLFSREGTRVYTKPIEKGSSKYHLSDEEEAAINNAIKNAKI